MKVGKKPLSNAKKTMKGRVKEESGVGEKTNKRNLRGRVSPFLSAPSEKKTKNVRSVEKKPKHRSLPLHRKRKTKAAQHSRV